MKLKYNIQKVNLDIVHHYGAADIMVALIMRTVIDGIIFGLACEYSCLPLFPTARTFFVRETSAFWPQKFNY